MHVRPQTHTHTYTQSCTCLFYPTPTLQPLFLSFLLTLVSVSDAFASVSLLFFLLVPLVISLPLSRSLSPPPLGVTSISCDSFPTGRHTCKFKSGFRVTGPFLRQRVSDLSRLALQLCWPHRVKRPHSLLQARLYCKDSLKLKMAIAFRGRTIETKRRPLRQAAARRQSRALLEAKTVML